jgi:drug/metabolite transporter (DMT)-like permease
MSPVARAALWMVGAIASFTLMAIAGRAVSFALDTFEIMLYRSVVGILIVLAVGGVAGTLGQIRRQRLGLHFSRNLAHFAGQNLWFYAITVAPLAQVFALEFTTPIWVMLLSPLFLGEPLRRIGLLAAGIGFVGVLLVARPDPSNLSPGVVTAAIAAIGFALTALLTKRLTRTETITGIMFWLTVMQAVFGLIAAAVDGDVALPAAATAPWLMLIGCAGLLAHFCLTTALSLAPPSIVTPIDFARLPVIAVVGVLLYNEPIDLLVFAGALLIFGANWLNLTLGQR